MKDAMVLWVKLSAPEMMARLRNVSPKGRRSSSVVGEEIYTSHSEKKEIQPCLVVLPSNNEA